MKYFRILCGRPFGYELCEFDYEALRFGFDLVFDQDLDYQALGSDDFIANIATRHYRNVFVRCNYDQVEPWLKLDLQVIVKADSLIGEKPPDFQAIDMSQVLIEVYELDHLDFVSKLAPEAIIIKGNEAGGRVGPINNFTFLQAALTRCNIPIIVQGGVGKHIIAGLFAAGCAGVLLDHQLALLDEAPTSVEARHAMMSLKADDFATFEQNQKSYRFVKKTYSPAFDALTEQAENLPDLIDTAMRDCQIGVYVREHLARNYDDILNPDTLIPAGIDLFFAKNFSEDFFCFKGLKEGLYQMLLQVTEDLNHDHPFGPDNHFSRQHHIKYPIFQGPMANVSDVAEFAVEVAKAGAMPFLAVGYLPGQESARMVQCYKSLAPDQPLGLGLVGIFETFDGYTKIDDAIGYGPDYVVMAGGFINYGKRLENAGIRTYLHTPSEKIFLDTITSEISGVILEGNEAGGHISKLSSFSLWQSCLYALEAKGAPESNKTIVLAGGITGESSVQFCAGLVSSFKDCRVSFGLQAGSLFLTCREVVTCGALDARYQELVLSSNCTVVTGSTVGLPQRQIYTPRVQAIVQWESSHDRSRDYKAIRMEYEANNRGGLRIAAKSEIFNCECLEDKTAPAFLRLEDEEEYYQKGLFYVGQNVCLLNCSNSLTEIMDGMFSAAAQPFRPSFELNPALLSRESKIAVVGLGCFLPDSPSTAHFWHNIKEGTYSIREVPPERWDPQFYYDPDKSAPNKTYSKIGAFVDDSLFAPIEYGIMPKTEKDLTRAQKFALTAVKEALDRVGIDYRSVNRARVGVFFGSSFTPELIIESILPVQADKLSYMLKELPAFPSDAKTSLNGFSQSIRSEFHDVTEDTLPNTLNSLLSARISHTFNFHGPNFISDAACASSMAAIQNAIDALRANRVDLAIVGSASSSTDIWTYVGFAKSGALSPDLSCPFDQRANGFVIGEGAGVLLLKRMEDAEREDDQILGIIAGIGSSSDGGNKGITAPNPVGQALALKRAYRDAAISPATIGFVEAHGTSTQLGDVTEFNTLTEVYRRHIPAKAVIPTGSVKGQIGHLLAAAGIVGLIKTLLCLSQGLKPKSVNFNDPNPKMGAEDSPLYINRSNSPWVCEDSKPRRAAVSSMGFGGTNFHVVLEEHLKSSHSQSSPLIIRLGGNSKKEVEDRLSSLSKTKSSFSLNDHGIIYDLLLETEKAASQPFRLSFLINTAEPTSPQLASVQEALNHGGNQFLPEMPIWNKSTSDSSADEKICIMFPGQGSEFLYMGLDLVDRFPESRRILRTVDRISFKRWGVSLSAIIRGDARIGGLDGLQLLNQTEYCQPAVFTISLAYYEILRSLGLKPFCAIGHSLGEYSALVAAGALDLEEALLAVMERGRAMARHSVPGTMAAVLVELEAVQECLKEMEGVYLANLNSDRQQVISGSREALENARNFFETKGISFVPLPVTGAFHSPLMTEVQCIFKPILEGLTYKPPQFTVYSNVRAQTYPAAQTCSFAALNLLDQIVAPVHFMDQVHKAHKEGANLFLEAGPGSVLSKIVQSLGLKAMATMPKGHDPLSAFLRTVLSLSGSVSSLNLTKLNRRLSLGLKGVDLSLKPGDVTENNRKKRSGSSCIVQASATKSEPSISKGLVVQEDLKASRTLSTEKVQKLNRIFAIIQQLGDPVLLGLFSSPKFSLFVQGHANIICDTVVKTILDTFRDFKRAKSTVLTFQKHDDKRLTKGSSPPGVQNLEKTSSDVEKFDFERLISSLSPTTNIGFLTKQLRNARGSLAQKAKVAQTAVQLLIQNNRWSYNRVVQGGHGPTATVLDMDGGFAQDTDIWITNHYLGFNRHPKVMQSSAEAALKYGTGCGTSAAAGGVIDIHHDLTRELASLLGKERAILFSTGFTANFGFLSSVVSSHDIVIFDEECHASIIEGILHSGATYRTFRHNDVDHLKAKLDEAYKQNTYPNVFVIIETVYSLSGEECPVRDICALKDEFDFYLFVDEAHSFGFYGLNGAGLCADHGVLDHVDFLMSTLSKATASLGGFVACDSKYYELVRTTARPYMFQATLTPPDAAAALASLRLLTSDSSFREKLWANNTYFRKCLIENGFDLGKSVSPIVPIYVSDYDKLTSLCAALFQEGVYSTVIGYPGVPLDKGRLRFIVTANHETEGIERTVAKLTKHAKRLRII